MIENPYKLNALDKKHLEIFKQTKAFKMVENVIRQHSSEFVGWSEYYLILFIMYCLAPSEVKCSDAMRKEFERKSKVIYANLQKQQET